MDLIFADYWKLCQKNKNGTKQTVKSVGPVKVDIQRQAI